MDNDCRISIGCNNSYYGSLCNDEYTEKLGKISHNSVVTSTQEATCTKAGAKHYKCSTCGYEYTEEIPQKSHSYSAATCTKPKTCSICGKTEGTALGHSTGSVKCSKCGEVTFTTLTYTGTGSKIIKNISVPNGRFIISGYAVKNYGNVGSFYMYLNYSNGSRAAYWITSLYSDNQTLEKAETFQGAMSGGILEIQADDNISWTITIEAVGN